MIYRAHGIKTSRKHQNLRIQDTVRCQNTAKEIEMCAQCQNVQVASQTYM